MSRPSASAQFDPEVIEELRRQFQSADKDGDGEIDAAEACEHFAQCCAPGASQEEVRRTAEGLRHQLDSDRSGTISFDEYCFRFGRKYQMERNRARRSGSTSGVGQTGARLDPETEDLARERAALELEREREALRREREQFERERQAFRQPPGPTPSAPPPDNAAPQPLVAGVRVTLHGLQGAASLNGTAGVVRRFDAASGRYVVELDGGAGQKSLKGDNLRPVAVGSGATASGGFSRFLSSAQDFSRRAILQVQNWLAGYETWQILLGIGLVVLFLSAWLQVSNRYPGGNVGADHGAGRGGASTRRQSGGGGGGGGGGAQTRHRSEPYDDDYDDYDDGYHRGGGSGYGGGSGGGGGLLGMLGGGGPMQWYLMVGGLGFLCWKGIIPVHKMSFFQLYMLWNMVEPLLTGGGGGRRMMGGFGRRRRGFF